jgi:mono/diheme cytochrome c family protein
VTSQRKRSILLLIVLGLIAAIAWHIEASSTKILTVHHAVPAHLLGVAPIRSAANDGYRLAHVNGCFDCHGEHLAGRVAFADWFGTRLVAPNLTRLARQETDAQLANAIRYGVKRDGTSVFVMPSNEFTLSSDSDIAAMISYLKSLPERPDTAEKTHWRFGGRAMLAMGLISPGAGMINLSALGPVHTPTSPYALGRYITQAHCSVCHGTDLSGDTMANSPDLRFAIRHYSLVAFEHFFSTGEGQIGHGTTTMTKMIRSQFKYLTRADVGAIYVYLNTDNHF